MVYIFLLHPYPSFLRPPQSVGSVSLSPPKAVAGQQEPQAPLTLHPATETQKKKERRA